MKANDALPEREAIDLIAWALFKSLPPEEGKPKPLYMMHARQVYDFISERATLIRKTPCRPARRVRPSPPARKRAESR
jgi:hypothetical protein